MDSELHLTKTHPDSSRLSPGQQGGAGLGRSSGHVETANSYKNTKNTNILQQIGWGMGGRLYSMQNFGIFNSCVTVGSFQMSRGMEYWILMYFCDCCLFLMVQHNISLKIQGRVSMLQVLHHQESRRSHRKSNVLCLVHPSAQVYGSSKEVDQELHQRIA